MRTRRHRKKGLKRWRQIGVMHLLCGGLVAIAISGREIKKRAPPRLVSEAINFYYSKSLGLQYIVIGTIGIHVPCL